ncbi:TRAP transporter large permease subunit, partial [Pseudomonas sp. SB113]|uniref:TRAP transporter large permease subunit n=1 Tax=Pseudomonas sp. SB113 TaxID=3154123 RepID=UPI00345CB750
MITIRCWVNPELAPATKVEISAEEKRALLLDAWPLPVLIAGVRGGIFTGIFTATEAGAVGAFLAFAIALLRGRLTMPVIRKALVDTASGTSSIFIIVVGAALFARFVALATLPTWIMGFFEGFDTITVIL